MEIQKGNCFFCKQPNVICSTKLDQVFSKILHVLKKGNLNTPELKKFRTDFDLCPLCIQYVLQMDSALLAVQDKIKSGKGSLKDCILCNNKKYLVKIDEDLKEYFDFVQRHVGSKRLGNNCILCTRCIQLAEGFCKWEKFIVEKYPNLHQSTKASSESKRVTTTKSPVESESATTSKSLPESKTQTSETPSDSKTSESSKLPLESKTSPSESKVTPPTDTKPSPEATTNTTPEATPESKEVSITSPKPESTTETIKSAEESNDVLSSDTSTSSVTPAQESSNIPLTKSTPESKTKTTKSTPKPKPKGTPKKTSPEPTSSLSLALSHLKPACQIPTYSYSEQVQDDAKFAKMIPYVKLSRQTSRRLGRLAKPTFKIRFKRSKDGKILKTVPNDENKQSHKRAASTEKPDKKVLKVVIEEDPSKPSPIKTKAAVKMLVDTDEPPKKKTKRKSVTFAEDKNVEIEPTNHFRKRLKETASEKNDSVTPKESKQPEQSKAKSILKSPEKKVEVISNILLKESDECAETTESSFKTLNRKFEEKQSTKKNKRVSDSKESSTTSSKKRRKSSRHSDSKANGYDKKSDKSTQEKIRHEKKEKSKKVSSSVKEVKTETSKEAEPSPLREDLKKDVDKDKDSTEMDCSPSPLREDSIENDKTVDMNSEPNEKECLQPEETPLTVSTIGDNEDKSVNNDSRSAEIGDKSVDKEGTTTDESKTVEKDGTTTDESKTVDKEVTTTDESKTVEKEGTTTDESKTVDKEETTDESKTVDKEETTDESKTVDKEETTDESKTVDKEGTTTHESKTVDKDAKSIDKDSKSIDINSKIVIKDDRRVDNDSKIVEKLAKSVDQDKKTLDKKSKSKDTKKPSRKHSKRVDKHPRSSRKSRETNKTVPSHPAVKEDSNQDNVQNDISKPQEISSTISAEQTIQSPEDKDTNTHSANKEEEHLVQCDTTKGETSAIKLDLNNECEDAKLVNEPAIQSNVDSKENCSSRVLNPVVENVTEELELNCDFSPAIEPMQLLTNTIPLNLLKNGSTRSRTILEDVPSLPCESSNSTTLKDLGNSSITDNLIQKKLYKPLIRRKSKELESLSITPQQLTEDLLQRKLYKPRPKKHDSEIIKPETLFLDPHDSVSVGNSLEDPTLHLAIDDYGDVNSFLFNNEGDSIGNSLDCDDSKLDTETASEAAQLLESTDKMLDEFFTQSGALSDKVSLGIGDDLSELLRDETTDLCASDLNPSIDLVCRSLSSLE